MPANLVNKSLHLKRRPVGEATPDDFEVREGPVPELGDGDILVQGKYLSVDAALRLIIQDSDDFLFRVELGDLVRSTGIGEVVASNNPDYQVGEHVLGGLGVQNYTISDGADFEKVDDSLAPYPAWLGGFGTSGLTAYFCMLDVGEPNEEKTVVVNGAAGAVGSMAGQFAKIKGARTIGITSTDEKCRWLTDEVGYDVAINYNKGDLYEALKEAAPDRIDVIFDNVGGPVLDESLRWIGMRGKVLLCGATSQYTEEKMVGPSNYIWLGTMRACMQGFVVFDYADQYEEARKQMSQWMKEGKLKMFEYVVDGDVGDYMDVFQQMYRGKNLGKTVVRMPGAA